MKKIFFLLCFSWVISICQAQTDVKPPAQATPPQAGEKPAPEPPKPAPVIATPAPAVVSSQPTASPVVTTTTQGNTTSKGDKSKKEDKSNNNKTGNSKANTELAPVASAKIDTPKIVAVTNTNTETTQQSKDSVTIDSLKRKIGVLDGNVSEKYSLAVLLSLIGVIVGLLIGLIVVIFKSEDLKSTIKRLRGERDQLQLQNTRLQGLINDNSKSSNNANQQQQSTTTALIRELEAENVNLKEKLALALASKGNETSRDNSQTVIIAPAKVYYFSTPQADGSFNDSNKSDMFTPTSSMYKFTLLSNTKAHFEFINDESTLKDAINYPDTYLLPVCRAENTRNIKATKITTIGKGGVAELNNGRWEVKEKAVIRYE